MARAEAREKVRPPTLDLPERERAVSYSSTRGLVREARKSADPAPNAPQLIRLVRTPFALDRGAFARQALVQADPTRQPRSPYREELIAAFADAKLPRWPSPTESRPVAVPLRDARLPVDAWLTGSRRLEADRSDT